MTNSNGNYTSGTTITVTFERNYELSETEFVVRENAQEVARFAESEHEQAVAFASEIAEYGDEVIDAVPSWVHRDIEVSARFNKWADDLAEQMGGGFVITETGVKPYNFNQA